jgi:hypothetical protein
MTDIRETKRIGREPSAGGDLQLPLWRAILLRVLLVPAALITLMYSSGIVMFGQAEAGQHYIYGASTAWKLLSMGGALVLIWTAARSVLGTHWWVVGLLVWTVLTALSDQHGATYVLLPVGLALVLVPVLALRPRRRDLLRPDLHPSLLLLSLALVAAVPLVPFAIRLARQATRFPADGTTAELLFDSAGVALSLAMVGVYAALRPHRTRWLPLVVAAAAVWSGVFGLIWPQDLGSPGTGGGAAMLVGGLVFGAAGLWAAGRGTQPVLGGVVGRRLRHV